MGYAFQVDLLKGTISPVNQLHAQRKDVARTVQLDNRGFFERKEYSEQRAFGETGLSR